MNKIYIGTSGFNYKHWRNGVFYPVGLPQKKWLEYYSGKFNSVELNVTFYRLPKASTLENWRMVTGENFCFSIKGSRYITHIKKLIDVEDALYNFSKNLSFLVRKNDAVLWQFGENFTRDLFLLSSFLKLISRYKPLKNIRHAFEFRDASWFDESVYKVLKKSNSCLVIADSGKWPKVEVVTADFVYMRFHGRDTYSSNYTNAELKNFAQKTSELAKGRDVYAYFNNDAMGYAPYNALKFKGYP